MTLDLLIHGIVALGFAILGGFLWFGRGAGAIAGYNTMSARERERIDKRKLCRATACYLWFVGLLLVAGTWNGLILAVGLPISAFAFIVWANTGHRFEKRR